MGNSSRGRMLHGVVGNAIVFGTFETCFFLVGGAVASTYGIFLGSLLVFVTNVVGYFYHRQLG